MGEKYAYHIPLPEECAGIEKLYEHLCDAPVARGHRGNVSGVYPEVCATCVISCKYGKKLLEIWETNKELPKIRKTALA